MRSQLLSSRFPNYLCLRPQAGLRRRLSRHTRLCILASLTLLGGCHRNRFPSFAADYREFAYVSDGSADTVTVLDLVNLRQDRTVQVGRQPSGLAVNPRRNEIYAVNTGSDSVSVIDTETNRVTATIAVHRAPYFLSVAPDGKRG